MILDKDYSTLDRCEQQYGNIQMLKDPEILSSSDLPERSGYEIQKKNKINYH